MVEGGPATARAFLHDCQVDRALFVYAPLTFETPILSQLSRIDFEQAGLEQIHHSFLGVDHVEYWSRPNLPWPDYKDGSEEQEEEDVELFWP
jgi:riboflavin biosynthesis pyrimidine reductase